MIQSHLLPDYSSSAGLRIINPATGDLLALVPNDGPAEVETAVAAASRAMAEAPTLEERAGWLRRIAADLRREREELARIITLEQGKPLEESRAEVDYAAGFFAFFAERTCLLEPRQLTEPIHEARWRVHHRPAGVAALLTPWNFPLAMLAKKFAAALGASCAMVIKPAELTPLSACALTGIAREAGVAAGFVNMVIGQPGPIGLALCEHPAVRVISFTGSTETGKLLLRQTAGSIKRLALELGGNAPFIVFEDADIQCAADQLMASKFRCAGQTCVCANRIFVHRSIAGAFTDAVVRRVARLRVGDGMEPGTDVGPLINKEGFEKVARHVADALANGARRVFGAEATPPEHDWGCYYPPTVLENCDSEMLLFREETFGPVIAIATFEEEADVLARANGTPYGLAAYVFTADHPRAERCAAALHFGHIGLNSGLGPTPEAPFGGMKDSGLGREGGDAGLLEFVELQTVATGK